DFISDTLTEEEINVLKKNKAIISHRAFELRKCDKRLVDAKTGGFISNTLMEKEINVLKKNKEVISYRAFKWRKSNKRLVDAKTGNLISETLTEKEINVLKKNKAIITYPAFKWGKYRSRLVDAKTGDFISDTLTEEEINVLKKNKAIISYRIFKSHEQKRRLLDDNDRQKLTSFLNVSSKKIRSEKKKAAIVNNLVSDEIQKLTVKNVNFFQSLKCVDKSYEVNDKRDELNIEIQSTAKNQSESECEAINYLLSSCEEKEILNNHLPTDKDWLKVLQASEDTLLSMGEFDCENNNVPHKTFFDFPPEAFLNSPMLG
ncbi:MAG: hypothetical protein REH83_02925, partial [Rickettsiella sp.]|nr:hypothetical protein [Rickettsiella sp.]